MILKHAGNKLYLSNAQNGDHGMQWNPLPLKVQFSMRKSEEKQRLEIYRHVSRTK